VYRVYVIDHIFVCYCVNITIDASRSYAAKVLLVQSMYVCMSVTKVNPVHTISSRAMKFHTLMAIHMRNKVPKNIPEI
jgi:hypothetical protein